MAPALRWWGAVGGPGQSRSQILDLMTWEEGAGLTASSFEGAGLTASSS